MGRIKHTKRFLLRFYTWTYDYPVGVRNYTDGIGVVKKKIYDDEADTYDEIMQIKKDYLDMYFDVKEPELIGGYYMHTRTGKKVDINGFTWIVPSYDRDQYKIIHKEYLFDDNMFFYGFVIIDFEKEEVLEISKSVTKDIDLWARKSYPHFNNTEYNLLIKDQLFRGDDEIPNDYKWDDGEYAGWLQYRWGNGLNAIEKEDEINERKVEEERIKKEKRDAKRKADKEYLTYITNGYEEVL